MIYKITSILLIIVAIICFSLARWNREFITGLMGGGCIVLALLQTIGRRVENNHRETIEKLHRDRAEEFRQAVDELGINEE